MQGLSWWGPCIFYPYKQLARMFAIFLASLGYNTYLAILASKLLDRVL